MKRSRLDAVFRALGEGSAIVLLSWTVYLVLALAMAPKAPSTDLAGVLGCWVPLFGLIWFPTRLAALNSSKARTTRNKGKRSKRTNRYDVMKRAYLKRVAVPTMKKKKRDSNVLSDAAYFIHGRGTQATDPIDLDYGMYRLVYQLPTGVRTTITLIQRLTGEEAVLLDNRHGTGSQTFMVEEADRYIFQVTIKDAQTPTWKFEVERL